jgi:hypothetical protein
MRNIDRIYSSKQKCNLIKNCACAIDRRFAHALSIGDLRLRNIESLSLQCIFGRIHACFVAKKSHCTIINIYEINLNESLHFNLYNHDIFLAMVFKICAI